MYRVMINGRTERRHVDHIRSTQMTEERRGDLPDQERRLGWPILIKDTEGRSGQRMEEEGPRSSQDLVVPRPSSAGQELPVQPSQDPPPPELVLRRSTRVRRPPNRLSYA